MDAKVELREISIHTHHGVTEAEQQLGQRIEVSVSLVLADCQATTTDELSDTVDYAEVADVVVTTATERSYRTLERLAAVIAERLAERFEASEVTVRAAKPDPPMPVALRDAAVEVVRRGG